MPITTNVERRFLTASTLTGDEVRNPQGEKLGDIKEIMLDVEMGRIPFPDTISRLGPVGLEPLGPEIQHR